MMSISVLKTSFFSTATLFFAPQDFKMYFNCLWLTELGFFPYTEAQSGVKNACKLKINEWTNERMN